MGWYNYGEYVPVAQKRAKAEKEIIKLRKKDATLSPVVIEGRKIAKTWWGMAWCKNLESYADYRNRIGRGSAYVKNGFVVDLKINEGVVLGKVMGTSLYDIIIKIDKLSDSRMIAIADAVGRKIGSVEDLINGKFPSEFGELFLTQNKGLFPSPKEIHMDCSCPDWADMCKHVAAVLYAVGARLDQEPMLFFRLRGVDMNAFIKASIDEKMSNMMKNAGKKTKRVMDGKDIGDIFGI